MFEKYILIMLILQCLREMNTKILVLTFSQICANI